MNLAEAFERAWERFCDYYIRSGPIDGAGSGNTKTICGERLATQYLGMFLNQKIHEEPDLRDYAVHQEFTIEGDSKRLDIAVIKPTEWTDQVYFDLGNDYPRIALAAEFKFLLHASSDESPNNRYNLYAIRQDCQRLADLSHLMHPTQLGIGRHRYMCVISRRKDDGLSDQQVQSLTRDLDVKLLLKRVPPPSPRMKIRPRIT